MNTFLTSLLNESYYNSNLECSTSTYECDGHVSTYFGHIYIMGPSSFLIMFSSINLTVKGYCCYYCNILPDLYKKLLWYLLCFFLIINSLLVYSSLKCYNSILILWAIISVACFYLSDCRCPTKDYETFAIWAACDKRWAKKSGGSNLLWTRPRISEETWFRESEAVLFRCSELHSRWHWGPIVFNAH